MKRLWMHVCLIGLVGVPSSIAMAVTPESFGPFTATTDAWPDVDRAVPPPATPAPQESLSLAFDAYGNYWTLGPVEPSKPPHRRLLVLPAQRSAAWIPDEVSRLPAGDWRTLVADEHGALWVADDRQVLRMDPLTSEVGWEEISADSHFPVGPITAVAVGPNGSVVAAVGDTLVTMDRPMNAKSRPVRWQNELVIEPAPSGVRDIITDRDGRLWLRTAAGKVYRKPAAPDAWQRHWEIVARMPGSNHDLSGDLLGDTFYMAGGLTSGYGYPPEIQHPFTTLFAYEGRSKTWRVVADLGVPRVYNATGVLGGKVWIVGGAIAQPDRSQPASNLTQIYDPATGTVEKGPDCLVASPLAVGLSVGGRLYVAGNPRDGLTMPLHMQSIGVGEKAWRKEPDGPTGFGSPAAAALDGVIYLSLEHKSLAAFDTKTSTWKEIEVPRPPRSCQMAAYKNEIWLMGGRGVREGREVQIFDPRAGTWRAGPDLPRELVWGAAAVIDGRLTVIGGAGGRCYSHYTFALRDDAEGDRP